MLITFANKVTYFAKSFFVLIKIWYTFYVSKNKHSFFQAKSKSFSEKNSDKLTLPQDFLCDFENQFGKDSLAKYIECFEKPSVKGVRFNNLKGNSDLLKDFYQYFEKIPYFENCYYVENEQKLGNSILHQSGAFYVQEPSSMIPVASVKNLDFQNKLVLDLCASPGGKSTQIASLMNNTGLLVSNEINFSRAKVLFSNIERLGIKNCIVLNETPQNLANNFKGIFDYIFVDAPCEGMFRKDNLAIKEWNSNLKFYNQTRQLEILKYANEMLKSGGTLVYSTCTFNLIENEQVVDSFSKTFNYKIMPVCDDAIKFTVGGKTLNDNWDLANSRHFFPFYAKGEGQFVAVLKKEEQNVFLANSRKQKQLQVQDRELKIIKNFISENLNSNFELSDYLLTKNGEQICILKKQEQTLNLTGIRTICQGVILGEIVKDRLEVHHQFFSAYSTFFKNYIDLNYTSEFLKKFAKGEELTLFEVCESKDLISYCCGQKGYGVIKASGYALGGFKIVDGKLKNAYPKALRVNNSF